MYKITVLIKIDKYFSFMFGKSHDCQQNLKKAFHIIRATSFVPFVVPPCVTAITKVTHEVDCSYYYYVIFKPASRKKKEGKQCSPPKDSFLQEPEVHHMAQTFTIVRFELRKSVNGSREEVTHLMIIFEEMVNKTC